jgi:hypothetical protein
VNKKQSIDLWPAGAYNNMEKGRTIGNPLNLKREKLVFQVEWDWNYNIDAAGIPTGYTAGIPARLRLNLKNWSRKRETVKISEEDGWDATNRATGRGGFWLNSESRKKARPAWKHDFRQAAPPARPAGWTDWEAAP